MTGIQSIEILDKPASGLVGLKWRETRMMFGKPASVDKVVIEAAENDFYRTRAQEGGFVFITTKSVAEGPGGATLTERHETIPQGFMPRLMCIPMRLFFKGVAKKAVLQDMNDIKAAVERK